MKELKGKNFHAFTLVELIIVISVLALLTAISFMSFQGYVKSARDSKKVTTLSQVVRGVQTFQASRKIVPPVDDKIGTGTINGQAVVNVGYIGDNFSKLLKIDKTPLDPLTNTKYIYATDVSQRKYQVGVILENLQTYTNPFVSSLYADGGVKAKVEGNYKGLLKYNEKIYNIPSLIITFSGTTTQDLLAANTNYVIDKSENLPYLGAQAKVLNTLSPTKVLQKLTGAAGILSLTGVVFPSDACRWNTSSGGLQLKLGYDKDIIGQTIFGNDYFVNIKGRTSGCSLVIPTCSPGQGYDGVACVPATQCNENLQSIALSNGQNWSCLNLGATAVRDGVSIATSCGVSTNCNSALTWLGNYYQRGRDDPVDIPANIPTYNGSFTGSLGHNKFVLGESTNGDWWLNESGSYTPARWTGVNPQGPCPEGWHVPTATERKAACDIITGTNCANNPTTVSVVMSTLKLPFVGLRLRYAGHYFYQNDWAYYWSSSTPSTVGASSFRFNALNINTNAPDRRSYGFAVRCLKN